MTRAALLAAAALALAAAAPVHHRSAATAAAGRPFSDAVEAGGLVFLSGQIGTRPGAASPVPGGLEPEARQTMDNIGATLATLGLGYGDLVKCTVFLASMADWPAFNAVYATYFAPGQLPARSALGANGLALGARVEVECIAARR